MFNKVVLRQALYSGRYRAIGRAWLSLLLIGLALFSGRTFPGPPVTADSDGELTLALAGDLMLGRQVDAAIGLYGADYIWGDVLPLLRRVDLLIANLETVIARSGTRFLPERVFYFRADPERALAALRTARVDYVSMANNHAMDFTEVGLLETIRHLDGHGIAHAGAGRDRMEAARPAWLEIRGLKLAVLAFADHFQEYAAGRASAGINLIHVDAEGDDFERVRTAIRAAREAGADLVVFSIHWGPNMREAPTPRFIRFAHAVIDAGADLFHGHSAHLFQGIEIYKSKPIFYDTGDLVDDYYVYPRLRNDRQLLFVVHVAPGGAGRVELVPLRISNSQVMRAVGDEFEAIADRLRDLSSPFGTELRRPDQRLLIDLH